MNRFPLLLLSAVLLGGCAGADTPTDPSDTHAVNAAVTHNRQREVVIEDQTVTNVCNGEDVLLHINQLFLLREVTVEGKFFHGHLTFLDRGTRGVGLTTGAVYRQTGAEQDFLHIRGEVGSQERIHVTINLISQGSLPNIVFTEVFRVKIGPGGEIQLNFDRVRQHCRG
jgi:hypothetical protein